MAKKGRPSSLTDPLNNGWCSDCKTEQPKENFFKNKSRSTGIGSRCKVCNLKNKRERYRKSKEDEFEKELSDLKEKYYRPDRKETIYNARIIDWKDLSISSTRTWEDWNKSRMLTSDD